MLKKVTVISKETMSKCCGYTNHNLIMHGHTYMYPYLPKLFILLLPLFFNQIARFCIVIL